MGAGQYTQQRLAAGLCGEVSVEMLDMALGVLRPQTAPELDSAGQDRGEGDDGREWGLAQDGRHRRQAQRRRRYGWGGASNARSTRSRKWGLWTRRMRGAGGRSVSASCRQASSSFRGASVLQSASQPTTSAGPSTPMASPYAAASRARSASRSDEARSSSASTIRRPGRTPPSAATTAARAWGGE